MRSAGQFRAIPADGTTAIGDFRRYPGCRLLLSCTACSWSKPYDPERIIHRLQELKAGGHATQLWQVAKRIPWPCPACGRDRFRMQFVWPPSLSESEMKRLRNAYRN